MSPELLYEICLKRAHLYAHDQQAAEAAANGAAANIWLIPNKPADAHKDERIWRYWARYYVPENYRRENMRRDGDLMVSEADLENELHPAWEKEPDGGYIDMLMTESNPRHIEAIVEGRETEAEMMRLIQNTVTPAQGRILCMLAEGLTAQEIAEYLGTGVKYVYDRATMARKRLRQAHPDIPESYLTTTGHHTKGHSYYYRHPNANRVDSKLEWRLSTGDATYDSKHSARL